MIRMLRMPPSLASVLFALVLLGCADDDPAAPADVQSIVQDIVVVSGDGQEAEVRQLVPEDIILRAVDQDLEPMPDARFTLFALDDGLVRAGGSLATEDGSSFSTDADSNGELWVDWALTTSAGSTAFRVTAYLPAQTDSAEVFVTALARPGPLSNVVQEGNNQAGTPGTELALPIAVVLLDYYGNPLSAVGVTWAIVSGGGSLPSSDVATSENGRSSAAWSLGAVAGDQRVSATIDGGGTVIFTALAQ